MYKGGCKLGVVNINIIGYADDIVILSYTKNNLEKMYKMLKDELYSLKLDINIIKTKCMVFNDG